MFDQILVTILLRWNIPNIPNAYYNYFSWSIEGSRAVCASLYNSTNEDEVQWYCFYCKCIRRKYVKRVISTKRLFEGIKFNVHTRKYRSKFYKTSTSSVSVSGHPSHKSHCLSLKEKCHCTLNRTVFILVLDQNPTKMYWVQMKMESNVIFESGAYQDLMKSQTLHLCHTTRRTKDWWQHPWLALEAFVTSQKSSFMEPRQMEAMIPWMKTADDNRIFFLVDLYFTDPLGKEHG